MKKLFYLLLLMIFILTLLCACNPCAPYDEEWIIGKTSLEIEEKYGTFYQSGVGRDNDGLFRSTQCHYVLKIERTIFGNEKITLFSIGFDENGIADSCFTQPGPIGG